MGGNFKVRCVESWLECFENGEIYDVVNGSIFCKDDFIMIDDILKDIKDFDDLTRKTIYRTYNFENDCYEETYFVKFEEVT